MSEKSEKKIRLCPGPFVSQAMWADGRATMCCNDVTTQFAGLEDEWSSPERKLAQQMWMDGKVPERCQRCIERDGHGESGLYSHYIHLYGHMSRYKLIKASRGRPRYLHLSPSNKCNLGCRMCDGFISSTYEKTYITGKEKVTSAPILDWIKQCDVDHYYMHGGEPLLSEEHYEAVQHLVTQQVIPTVVVLTNGTQYSKKWIELLKKVPNVIWQVSLDGHPGINDKLRFGTKSSLVEEYWWKVRQELPHAIFSIHSTFSVYNSFDLHKSFEYIAKFNPDRHSVCIGHNPGRISVSNLPVGEKTRLNRQLAEYRLLSIGEGPVWDNFPVAINNIQMELDENPRDPFGFRETFQHQNNKVSDRLKIDIKVI